MTREGALTQMCRGEELRGKKNQVEKKRILSVNSTIKAKIPNKTQKKGTEKAKMNKKHAIHEGKQTYES